MKYIKITAYIPTDWLKVDESDLSDPSGLAEINRMMTLWYNNLDLGDLKDIKCELTAIDLPDDTPDKDAGNA